MSYLSSSLNETLGSNVLSVTVINKTVTAMLNPISFVFETTSVSLFPFYISFSIEFLLVDQISQKGLKEDKTLYLMKYINKFNYLSSF